MLTYPLNKESGRSLYEQLYEGIRRDILSGTLPAHQRLPSKRALAQHLEVSIITVQNAYEQLAAEGYRWRDMGVCARNMEVYGPLLESVFRRDGIPAYISRRSDLLEKPPITMLLGALDAVTGGFDREDVFRCLKTGLGGITPDECDILENYVILWDIRGSAMWLREGDWTASPDGYGREPTERSAARLEQVNGIRLFTGGCAPPGRPGRRRSACMVFCRRPGCRRPWRTRRKSSWRRTGPSWRRNMSSCGRSSAGCWTSLRKSWGIRSCPARSSPGSCGWC